jgi:hypothetical protein
MFDFMAYGHRLVMAVAVWFQVEVNWESGPHYATLANGWAFFAGAQWGQQGSEIGAPGRGCA